MKTREILNFTVILFITLMGLFMPYPSYAKDLGVMGETYPIVETDFLDFIQARIAKIQQGEEWQNLKNQVQQDAIRYRDRPKKVDGLTRAQKTKSWTYDPSIRLDHDLIAPDGKRIATAGTHVNPLDYISLSKALIFYNGDDPDQVSWALAQDKKLNRRIKFILVQGLLLQQEKQCQKQIYFDQAGRLTARFGIAHVPAMVSQEGSVLRIKEFSL